MPVEQLLYQHDGVTFGLLVDPSMLEKFRNGEATAASVLDVYEVFKFATGKQGNYECHISLTVSFIRVSLTLLTALQQ
jgi:ribosome maturation protein Sdo1